MVTVTRSATLLASTTPKSRSLVAAPRTISTRQPRSLSALASQNSGALLERLVAEVTSALETARSVQVRAVAATPPQSPIQQATRPSPSRFVTPGRGAFRRPVPGPATPPCRPPPPHPPRLLPVPGAALPVPFLVRGRKMMIVADEDVTREEDAPPSFLWIVDITDEKHPVPIGTYQVQAEDGRPAPPLPGSHPPSASVPGPDTH